MILELLVAAQAPAEAIPTSALRVKCLPDQTYSRSGYMKRLNSA